MNTVIGLRKKNPPARIPETVFPSPYLLSQTEEQMIDDILAVFPRGMPSYSVL